MHSAQLPLALDGPALRDQALDLLAAARAAWITRAIVVAHTCVHLYGEVSADDIHERCPVPKEFDPRVVGAALRCRFRFLRYQPSRRPECHARPIAVWGAK